MSYFVTIKNIYAGKTTNDFIAWGMVAQAGAVTYKVVTMFATAVSGCLKTLYSMPSTQI